MFKRNLWWIAFVVTLIIGALATKNTLEFRSERLAVAEALAAPPEPILLADLLTAPDHPPLSEIAVYDIARYRSGVDDFQGNERAYFVVESDSEPPVFVAFIGAASDLSNFHLDADGLDADWDTHVVRGYLTNSTLYRSDIIDLMVERAPNMTHDNTVMAEHLGEDREAGYDLLLLSIALLEVIGWIATAIAGGITVFAYLGSRRRRTGADLV